MDEEERRTKLRAGKDAVSGHTAMRRLHERASSTNRYCHLFKSTAAGVSEKEREKVQEKENAVGRRRQPGQRK